MKLRYLLAVSLLLVATPVLSQKKDAPKPDSQKKEAPKEDKSAKPSQESVAAKGDFGTILVKAPEVIKSFEAVDLGAAKKLLNKEGSFKGKVVKVFKTKGVVILNFADDYKTAMVAVLQSENFAKFPSMETLKEKRVLVTGKIIDYQGRPEIIVTEPKQIKVIVQK